MYRLGTIFVGSLEQHAFNNDDLYVLEMVSEQIENAITNARQAETLTNSENRYRTLFEESPTWCIYLQQRFCYY